MLPVGRGAPSSVPMGLKLAEGKNNKCSDQNCTHQNCHGYYVILVLPIDNLAGRTTTAKERVRVHASTVAARSLDRPEHSSILDRGKLIETDPRQLFDQV